MDRVSSELLTVLCLCCRGRVVERRAGSPWPSDEGDMALCSRGEVCGEECFGMGSSQALWDFLCITSCDSVMLYLSRRLLMMGGELGGVVTEPEFKFWTEPGGEELGVII